MRHFISALQSVLAAFFGVQSEQKRRSDFQEHSISSIIAIAVILFIAFAISIYAVVALVVST
jgi:uncharacterized BrkB/YihY/UPF0761 family membrane protein